MHWSVSIIGVGLDIVILFPVTKLFNVVAEVVTVSQSASVNELINVSVVMSVEDTRMVVINSIIIAINSVAVVTIGSEVTVREAVV